MRYNLWPCVLLLFGGIALAKDDTDFMQDADFIEFMGGWETSDGDWIPPDEIEKMKIPKEDMSKTKNPDEADFDE